jgi:hypothetical protein
MFIHNSDCVFEQSIPLWLETTRTPFVANDKKVYCQPPPPESQPSGVPSGIRIALRPP